MAVLFNKSEFYMSALEKAKVAFGAKTDADLASKLGCNRTAIYHARERKTFPYRLIADACIAHNVSMDFILGIKKSNEGAK